MLVSYFFFPYHWLLCTVCLRIHFAWCPFSISNPCVFSKQEVLFLFCHPVFPTQFFLCSPQTVCSDNMSVHVCLLMSQPVQGSSSIMFLKHLWPTGIPEKYWANNNKDENAGDMHSSVSCGENQSMSLPVSGFNTSPHPLPHSENVCTAYTQIRSKWNNLSHWLSCKESACQCRRHRFNPWVRKFPWRTKWQPIRVFLPGESHEQSLVGYGPWGHKESDMT